MSKVVVSQFVSVDGVIEDPGGVEGFDRGGWAFQFDRGAEGDEFKLDELMASDALLLGRTTYEVSAASWTSRTGAFADKLNAMPKYVVSTTLESADWNNSTVIKDNVDREVANLKQQFSRDILVNGSAQLMGTLMQHDLVEEYRLMVFPVVLGAGKRRFAAAGDRAALRLTNARPVGADGVIILSYERTANGRQAGS